MRARVQIPPMNSKKKGAEIASAFARRYDTRVKKALVSLVEEEYLNFGM
jgi:hypothetical protein